MAKSFWVSTNITAEVKKALGDITKYDADTRQRLDGVIRDMTGRVFEGAVSRVPKKTGKLASSIKQEFRPTPRGLQGYVKAMDPIAHIIEFGAAGSVVIPIRKKALHPGAEGWFAAYAIIPQRAAHPFMKPAMDAVRPELERAVKEAVDHDK
ncbi:hypothetical protein [uncultured Megasphaera sp.]|uniref:hypothetical protein n=1 Tax=uncultured Megasphaera sp. TaxID=165188 RepID=UPI0025E69A67|nr:hypothetical protein [uncultured Megasphaera sp.]